MILLPGCKINIGLNIVGVRPNGYHNLQSVFVHVPQLSDVVEVTFSPDNECHLILAGIPIEGSSIDDNLCMKAYRAVKKFYPSLPAVTIGLLKQVPMGAGLGGGSADATAVIKALNIICKLGMSDGQMCQIAETVGADCPFFVTNQTAYVEGIGEIITPLDKTVFNLDDYTLHIIKPNNVHISTKEAYSTIECKEPEQTVLQLIGKPIETWQGAVVNDFQLASAGKFPVIQEIVDFMLANGALYAAMSGSGSSVFGLFPKGYHELPVYSPECYQM